MGNSRDPGRIVWDEVWYVAWEISWNRVGGSTTDRVWDQARAEVCNRIGEIVWDNVTENLTHRVYDHLHGQ